MTLTADQSKSYYTEQ